MKPSEVDFDRKPAAEHADALRRLRDMLGLARAVYGAARAAGKTGAELEQLAREGAELAAAHAELKAAFPGSVQADKAVARGGAAAERLGLRISPFAAAEDIVDAAAKRVVRGKP